MKETQNSIPPQRWDLGGKGQKYFDILSTFYVLHSTKAGFTLIEILVVATLIGLLSTIGYTGFQTITRSARDALRKSDIEQLRSALEIYKSEYKSYPSANGCSASFPDTTYINPYPADPKSPTYSYCYVPTAATFAQGYSICAHLENGGTSDVCSGAANCTGVCNYKVTNP